MTVSASWTNPSAGGTLDLSAGALVGEATWDAMVSNFLYLGGSTGRLTQAQYNSTGTAFSTTSTTTVSQGDLLSFTTSGGGDVIVTYTGAFTCTVAGAAAQLYIRIDSGTYVKIARWQHPIASQSQMIPCSARIFTGLSSAVHLFEIGWDVTSGTLSADSNVARSLMALELRR